MTRRKATGHRIAEVARRLGVHPVAPPGQCPGKFWGLMDEGGNYYDFADVFSALVDRIEALEKRKPHTPLHLPRFR